MKINRLIIMSNSRITNDSMDISDDSSNSISFLEVESTYGRKTNQNEGTQKRFEA